MTSFFSPVLAPPDWDFYGIMFSGRHLREFKWQLIGVIGKCVVDLICATLRIRVVGYEQVRPDVESRRFILAFWHSRILLVSYLYQGLEGAILVSASDDGEIMARILQQQGHETIRGSTTRYGVRALARMVKALRRDARPAAVVPDGPTGPRFVVQPGVIILAQKTGYPIVPISYSVKRAKIFSSWDRFILPCPFTEATVAYGRSVRVPRQLETQQREAYRVLLEDEMNRITREVDVHYGHRIE
ncbi:MAG: lysophospholipid acyltransferase family protein [Deltaproteobacteria bacterium]|nr:lysophospholipid acyltransferase family protein [Deltaproteobacteria bacterium]